MSEKYKITYRNDFVFKKTLAGDDDDSRTVLKFEIEAVTQRQFTEIVVTNGELLGDYLRTKRHFLDIRAKAADGEIINIEMQQGHLNQYQLQRIQMYASRSLANQKIEGEKYDALKKVEQIIFTSQNYEGELYTKYTLKDEEGKEMKNNLITYHIISLPHIEKVIKEKREEMSDLEILSYVYQIGIDDDIMKIANREQKKVLKIMKDKIQMVMENEEEYGYAVGEEYFEVEKEVRYADGYNKGEINMFIKFLQNKIPLSKEILQKLTTITEEKRNHIICNFDKIKTEEDLKQFLE